MAIGRCAPWVGEHDGEYSEAAPPFNGCSTLPGTPAQEIVKSVGSTTLIVEGSNRQR